MGYNATNPLFEDNSIICIKVDDIVVNSARFLLKFKEALINSSLNDQSAQGGKV